MLTMSKNQLLVVGSAELGAFVHRRMSCSENGGVESLSPDYSNSSNALCIVRLWFLILVAEHSVIPGRVTSGRRARFV